MAANVTGDALPARLLRDYFDAVLMRALEKDLVAKDLTTNRVIPANSGQAIVFHRVQNFAKQTTGITQTFGSAHSSVSGLLKGRTYSVDAVNASLILVGSDLQLSELLMMTSEPNPMPELSKRFLFNGADTLDQMCINLMVCSSANGVSNTATVPSIDYGGASRSVAVVWGDGTATLTEATLDADNPSHRISAESFNVAYATLRAQPAYFHPKLSGRRYAALISPGAARDLRMDATFQEIALRGFKLGESKFESAAVGDIFGCMVIESPNVSVNFPGTIDSTNDEILRCPIFGDEYAHTVSHATGVGRPRVSFIAPTPSAADPYGNNGYLSWKAYFAGTVVNPQAGVILKVATTAATPLIGGEWAEWQ